MWLLFFLSCYVTHFVVDFWGLELKKIKLKKNKKIQKRLEQTSVYAPAHA